MLTVLAAGFVFFVVPRFLASGTAPASTKWKSQHSRRLRDPWLSRYYLFTGAAANSQTRNLSGWHGSMLASPNPEGYRPRSVHGREDGLRAVRVDDLPMESLPASIGSAFTVEFRIRHHGQGFVRGGNATHSGTLVAMGDGIWNGFLFSLQFPANTLAFQLGHPKPSPAAPVLALSRLPADVWTHIAGTWDGKEVRIYVNGMLAGRRACSGPLFPVPRSSRLRVGYVGNGLGSVRFDIEHLALFGRCFSDEEILCAAWPEKFSNSDLLAAFLSSGRSLVRGDLDEARTALEAIQKAADADSLLKALAELRLGECARESESYATAEQWFGLAAADSRPAEIRMAAAMERHALSRSLFQPSSAKLRSDPAGPQGDNVWAQARAQLVAANYDFERTYSFESVDEWRRNYEATIWPILERSCTSCHHSQSSPPPDLTALSSSGDAIQVGDAFWRKLAVAIELQHPRLPPHTSISEPEQLRLLSWIDSRPRIGLCEELAEDGDAPRHLEESEWRTGAGAARRLTRSELRNAIRDLLNVNLSDDQLPPFEGSGGEGFDTGSSTLFTSSMLLETWMQAVQSSVEQAIAADSRNSDRGSCRILAVLPGGDLGHRAAASKCLESFARRAWRRQPLISEVNRLLELYDLSHSDSGDFLLALSESAKAVLLSPHFLLVSEPEPVREGEYELLPEQLATRMALFLWSSIPDDELLNAALTGRLSVPRDIRHQINRMLRDPRSAALGSNFGLQWLGLERATSLQPDTDIFQDWTSESADLLQQEAAGFVGHVLRENKPLTELLHANYVFANQQIAKYYGLPAPSTGEWQPIGISDGSRGGVLSLGAVLTATSRPGRTSPVLRGRWILENILGETVAPPPPDIPPLPEKIDPDAPLSLRERLEQHRSDPACASCHATMDQLGFGLEEFDPTGRLRRDDGTGLIDASGVLPSGEEFSGLAGLKQALRVREQQFLRVFCRRLLGYALGRGIDRFDECVVDRCLERLATAGNCADVVFEEIILSFPFRNRQALP